ncbi:uncharacterized protein LOC143052512 [Mytilus galloprovincialis]|uniref:uncharacterized protein LOC143052512 n=1 Tax=Mytilus galloprovincialis TaxID=29158 RepID=UPI003F7BDAD1
MNTKVTICVFACLFAFVIGQRETCMTSGDCQVLHCEETGKTTMCVQGVCICVERTTTTCTTDAECDADADNCEHQRVAYCYDGHCVCVTFLKQKKEINRPS